MTEKELIIADHFKAIMETLGLDLRDKSLVDTPKRIAKMYTREIFSGLDKSTFPRIMTVPNGETVGYNQMVIVDNIKVSSTCAHHWQPIDGVCHIAYIPKKKVLGLSKFPRIVRHFAKRPQIQEGLTEEIYKNLCEVLETEDIAIIIKARHFCMSARGVNEHNSQTTTSKMGGAFLNSETRAEFYNLLK